MQKQIDPSIPAQPDMPITPSEQSFRHSITDKREEQPWLRDEIRSRLGLGKDFFTQIFTVSAFLLPLSLQFSGLIGMLIPPIGLALAFKIGGNDLKNGQINFYLRRALRSVWEIFRRYVYEGHTITREERAILKEQEVLLPEAEIQWIRNQLSPRFSSLSAWGDKWGFLVFYAIGGGVGITRTYVDVLHGNPTTWFIWISAVIATVLTIMVMGRKRIRSMKDEHTLAPYSSKILERGIDA